MKTSAELKKMIEDKMVFMGKYSKASKEYRSSKREYDFYNICLLLIENNMTDEAIDRMIKKLSEQYQQIKLRYYEEFWYGKDDKFREENKRPSVAKFESRTGAGKLKYQLKTYKFLK